MKETFTMRQEDMSRFAERVIELLSTIPTKKAKIVLLGGDLGAGKTTFTKELASAIGIDKSKVTSPTFILKKEHTATHPVFKKLIHIDAYRFNTPQEAKILRLEDDLDERDTIVAVEWPSKMSYMKADVELLFTIIDDETREVAINYEEVTV